MKKVLIVLMMMLIGAHIEAKNPKSKVMYYKSKTFKKRAHRRSQKAYKNACKYQDMYDKRLKRKAKRFDRQWKKRN